MLLDKKVCLVTGASRGIGASIVENFARNGALVYANARTDGSLDETSKKLNDQCPGTVCPLYFDITDTDSQKEAFLRIRKEQGRLDVLVNNAGIMIDALIGMIRKTDIEQTFATNVYAIIDSIQFASKIMLRQKSGSIINIASIVGVEGNKAQLVYSASKGAVVAMTKSAAKELAPNGIRVNAVAPGVIDTDLLQATGPEVVEHFSSLIGMGRLGTPSDVAHACLFLASDLSLYITGQVIGVDGDARI